MRFGEEWLERAYLRAGRHNATERRSGSSRYRFRRNVAGENRCVLREVTLVSTGADAHVCPRVRRFRRERTRKSAWRRSAVCGCVREHNRPRMTRSDVDASSATFWLCFPYAHAQTRVDSRDDIELDARKWMDRNSDGVVGGQNGSGQVVHGFGDARKGLDRENSVRIRETAY